MRPAACSRLVLTGADPLSEAAQGSEFDVAVIGAGFGGIGAALALAEAGKRVVLLETLKYPGGCASTFTRDGYAFEAGATLFSGLSSEQLFGRWIARHRLAVEVDALDPLVTLRSGALTLEVPRERTSFVERMVALSEPRHGPALRRFFARQRAVADALWALFDDPTLLPPLDARSLLRHAGRMHRYLPLIPLLGRPLGQLVARDGLSDCRPLTLFLDAVCQITVQCSHREAEAPFALAALDYYFRGTGHVRGGIGMLASALCDAVVRLGGEVRFSTRVRALERDGSSFALHTRRGTVRAPKVVANLLPQDLAALLGRPLEELPELAELADEVANGWGAIMLYRAVQAAPEFGPGPRHFELVSDADAPFVDGNHVFVSISGAHESLRAPDGLRTLTASTHVASAPLAAQSAVDRGAHVAAIQSAMRRTIAQRLPELEGVAHELTASPRTFARFTGRAQGLVGGVPRRAGLSHYRRLGPLSPLPGLYLVGDSVFPGQSTLATALGGVRVAARIARE
jgi:phytoene dehydrogenase-like protein